MALTRIQMTTEIADVVGKHLTALAVSSTTLQARIEDKYINWAQQRIARHYNFHELNKYNESAATVADTKRYPLVTGTNNLGLVRPKDIYSIRLIDSANSRKVERWSPRKFDKYYPRPANYSTGRPFIYIRWGNDIELFKIPNAIYTLYIRYPQWATELTTDGQTTDFENKDQLLITATILETYLALEEYADARVYLELFRGRLKDAVKVEGDIDWEPQADEFRLTPAGHMSGEPWLDPYGSPGDPLYQYP